MKAVHGSGWIASGKSVTRKFEHESGWRVFHCGHPTALYPWGCIDPQGNLHTCGNVCAHGYAFQYLNDALAHAEAHIQDGTAWRGPTRAGASLASSRKRRNVA